MNNKYSDSDLVNINPDTLLTFSKIKEFLRKEPKATSYIIPEKYESIEDYAFSESEHPEIGQLREVIFNNKITKVPHSCFYCSSKIERIILSASVREVGASGFYSCKNLKNIENTQYLESIGFVSFKFCTNLKYIDLSGLSSIGLGNWAFECCINLENVLLPTNYQLDGSRHVFSGCPKINKNFKYSVEIKSLPLVSEIKQETAVTEKSPENTEGDSETYEIDGELPYDGVYDLELGDKCYSNHSYSEALYHYEKAARIGNGIAQLKMGLLYFLEEDIDINVFDAEFWLRKAKKQGIEEANDYLNKIFSHYSDIDLHKALGKIYRILSSMYSFESDRKGLLIRNELRQDIFEREFDFDFPLILLNSKSSSLN